MKFFLALIDLEKNVKIESYSTLKEGVDAIRRMPRRRWFKNRLLSEAEAEEAAKAAQDYIAAIEAGEDEEHCYSNPLPKFKVAGDQYENFEDALRAARAIGRADVRRGGALVCRVEGDRVEWSAEILLAFERAAEAHLAHYSCAPEEESFGDDPLRMYLRDPEDAPDFWWMFWAEPAYSTFDATVRRLARELYGEQ